MLRRASFLALVPLMLSVAGAAAEDWKVDLVEGQAAVFQQGSWVPLKSGDAIAEDSVVHTLDDGALRLTRERAVLNLMAKTEIQIVPTKVRAQTTIREHFGALGVEIAAEAPNPDKNAPPKTADEKRFSVQTPFMMATVRDAAFGVQTDANSSTAALKRGAMSVKDMLHNKETQIAEGQSVKATAAHGLVVGAANSTDPAVVAAVNAAGVAQDKTRYGSLSSLYADPTVRKAVEQAEAKAKAAAEAKAAKEAKEKAEAIAKAAAAADKATVDVGKKDEDKDAAGKDALDSASMAGAADGLGADSSGGGESARAEEVKAAMANAGMNPNGSPKKKPTAEDKAIAKAALKSAMGGKQEIDAEQVADAVEVASAVEGPTVKIKQPQPTDPNFSWIAVDDPHGPHLKSILGLVFQLDSTEAIVFWPVLIFFCGFMGMVFHMMLQDSSFGMMANTLMSIIAAFMGAGIRDLLFTNVSNITREPFITLGLVLGSVIVVMIGAAVARMKMNAA